MNSTRIAVSNSGPLIHLANSGLLDLIFKIYNKIIIPESVFYEVIKRGKEEGYSDALIIEQFINDNKIEVKKVPREKKYHSSNLHQGELDAIILALNSKSELILLDDDEARIFARRLKLKVRGTLGILIELVKGGYIDVESALKYLRELNSIMYLSSDIYNLVEDELKRIKN